MDEEIVEEFNERFNTIEETLKYIADSQAKSEFIHKKEISEMKEITRENSKAVRSHYKSFAV